MLLGLAATLVVVFGLVYVVLCLILWAAKSDDDSMGD